MAGLPIEYIKKYGVSKRAWAEFRKSKSTAKKTHSKKAKVKTMAKKRKSRAKVKTTTTRRTTRRTIRRAKTRSFKRSSPFEGILKKVALGAAGVVLATGVMDYATTGSLPTITTLWDRTQGIAQKLGQKVYLYPILLGGVLATATIKIPMVAKSTAAVIGFGMITAPLMLAATTPGSPGTPVMGFNSQRINASSRMDIIPLDRRR